MDLLEKRQYYINLFDFYESILTEKQRTYFQEYYFNDLSLAEIASNYNVSRNAIYDQVTTVISLLENYENKLKLYEKHQKRLSLMEKYSKENIKELKDLIEKLKGIE